VIVDGDGAGADMKFSKLITLALFLGSSAEAIRVK